MVTIVHFLMSMIKNNPFMNPCSCDKDEIYGDGKLTGNLCLNCYEDLRRERKMMEIECGHDLYQGLI